MLQVIASVLFLWLSWHAFQYRSKKPLPPGPKPLPLIGNIHQFPTDNLWRQYKKWHKKYGPLITLKMGPQTLISVGSHDIARNLLSKKQAIYNSRPRAVYMGECVFKGLNTGLMPYGPQWKNHNRIQTKFLRSAWVSQYYPIQDLETKHVLHELLTNSDIKSIFQRFACSINSTLAFGKRVEAQCQVMQDMSRINKHFNDMAETPLGMLVEFFPILNHLPFPIAPWKWKAEQVSREVFDLYLANLSIGKASSTWNWTREALEMEEAQGMSEVELANIMGFIFDAGSEPITGTLRMFVMTAAANPAAMAKAQDELDQVVGSDRLPTHNDLARLPYTHAVVMETLRWRPLIPAGFPHATLADDEFMGYRIPCNATIILNNWSLDLDETLYENPLEFCPERWLENPDLPLASFGFSRRKCPGQALARDIVSLTISRILWGYNIAPPLKNGQRAEVDTFNLEQGFSGPPVPFEVDFAPRSDKHRRIIEKEWNTAEKDPDVLMAEIASQIKPIKKA
ncbi:uncharacterized protein N7511_003902 [Penicillium nucicola]|uniref:uncharacterized protein n=1 Tax=Penicillium nucicola TaxID=1850975 RepID=UPI0025453858|nr:uncharacterized protein N7511_003902 [Penicillium nucicola]KAJ5766286.1 hypothetical protein N7511_003902 [Penicillium nucicola]